MKYIYYFTIDKIKELPIKLYPNIVISDDYRLFVYSTWGCGYNI